MAVYALEWYQHGTGCWLWFYMVTWLVKLEISELSRKSLHGLADLLVSGANALKLDILVSTATETQAALSVLIPTKENLPGYIPSLALSRDRADSMMFDTFSIINDVDR